MKPTAYHTISATVFGFVALAHVTRLIFHWPLEIGHGAVPGWISVLGLIAAGALSVWGFSLARNPRRPA